MAQVHHAAVQEKCIPIHYLWVHRFACWPGMGSQAHCKLKTLCIVLDLASGLHSWYWLHFTPNLIRIFRATLTLDSSRNIKMLSSRSTVYGKSYLAQAIGNHACTCFVDDLLQHGRLMEFTQNRPGWTYFLKLIKRIKRSSLLVWMILG